MGDDFYLPVLFIPSIISSVGGLMRNQLTSVIASAAKQSHTSSHTQSRGVRYLTLNCVIPAKAGIQERVSQDPRDPDIFPYVERGKTRGLPLRVIPHSMRDPEYGNDPMRFLHHQLLSRGVRCPHLTHSFIYFFLLIFAAIICTSNLLHAGTEDAAAEVTT